MFSINISHIYGKPPAFENTHVECNVKLNKLKHAPHPIKMHSPHPLTVNITFFKYFSSLDCLVWIVNCKKQAYMQ